MLKKQQLQETASKMQQLISSNEEFSRLSAELNNTIASLTVKLSDFRVKATEAKSSMEEIKARQDTVDESIKSAEAALAAENSKRKRTMQHLFSLMKKLPKIQTPLPASD